MFQQMQVSSWEQDTGQRDSFIAASNLYFFMSRNRTWCARSQWYYIIPVNIAYRKSFPLNAIKEKVKISQ
jgi:hypothetical protein